LTPWLLHWERTEPELKIDAFNAVRENLQQLTALRQVGKVAAYGFSVLKPL